MRSYKDTLEYMYAMLPMYQRQGLPAFKKDLDNIKQLLGVLGNPELKFRSIHIAGTNGKGSTSHYLASMLQESGLSVGLYTSPHYKDFRERIKINGVLITKKYVRHFIAQLEDIIQTINPSFFELTVAMAFDYFSKQKVDIAVIETGLGGRLDSTNVLHPILSVITNIGLDHQDMLGDTLEAIAYEKAGIIKHQTPVLVGERQSELERVFARKCVVESTEYRYADELLSIRNSDLIRIDKDTSIGLDLSSYPRYQCFNIRTAIAAFLCLQDQLSINIEATTIKRGIEHVHENSYFIGRWMQCSEHPSIIMDSAHNQDGIQHLVDQLEHIEFRNLHLVIGVVKGKDHHAILSLLPTWAKYYFANAKVPRAMDRKSLKDKATRYKLKGKTYRSVKQAFAAAKMSAHAEDLIIVCGSVFVIAELI